MVQSPKTSRRSIQSRRYPSQRIMRSGGLHKWVFICAFGACATIGILCVLHYFSNDVGRVDKSKQPEGVPKTSLEEELAALKEEEMELVQGLMRDFPNNTMALEQMGNFLSRHGQRTEAVVFWRKCLAIDSKYFNAHRGLGMVALDRGEYERALEHYRAAAQIRPDAEGIHVKIGEALVGLGRYDDAIREVQEELRISPRAAAAHFLLGQAYLKQKAYEKAQSHYEKALELDPKYANACYGLARVFVAMKQLDKAREYQVKFRALAADESQGAYDDRMMGTVDYLASARTSVAQALLDAEKLYRGRRDFSRCEAFLKRAVIIDPNNSKCFERLGLLYSMTKRYTEALRQFERITELEPSNPRSYLNMGTILIVLKRYDEAEIAYRKVIALVPEHSQGYLELARLYLNANKKHEEARKLAQKAISLEALPRGYFILSWACDVTGDRSGALKAIEEAVRLEPENQRYRKAYERIKSGL